MYMYMHYMALYMYNIHRGWDTMGIPSSLYFNIFDVITA